MRPRGPVRSQTRPRVVPSAASQARLITSACLAKKIADGIGRDVDVFRRSLRAHRQRDHLAAEAFGTRLFMNSESQPLMCPHWLRPVDKCFDASAAQMLSQSITARRTHHVVLKAIKMIFLVEVWKLELSDSSQPLTISRSNHTSVFEPARKMTQLDVEHCSLNVV